MAEKGSQEGYPEDDSTRRSGKGTWLMVMLVVAAMVLAACWYASAWLRQELEKNLAAQGLDVQYEQVQWHAVGLRFTGVQVTSTQWPQALKIDSADLRPDWHALLNGHLRSHLHLIGDFFHADVIVDQQADDMLLRDLAAEADLGWLVRWLRQPLPLSLSGRAVLAGNLVLDVRSGCPINGNLSLRLQGVDAGMGNMRMTFGDYALSLSGIDYVWLWQVGGGNVLMLDGTGQVMTHEPDPERWPLQGKVMLRGNESGIGAVLTPPQGQTFRLAGTLGSPSVLQ